MKKKWTGRGQTFHLSHVKWCANRGRKREQKTEEEQNKQGVGPQPSCPGPFGRLLRPIWITWWCSDLLQYSRAKFQPSTKLYLHQPPKHIRASFQVFVKIRLPHTFAHAKVWSSGVFKERPSLPPHYSRLQSTYHRISALHQLLLTFHILLFFRQLRPGSLWHLKLKRSSKHSHQLLFKSLLLTFRNDKF